jgi:hypothetical protein
MKAKFISLPKRWLEAFRKENKSVKLPAWLGSFSIPIVLDGISPTRVGMNAADKSPFYDSRVETLYGYYSAYQESRARRYRLLYADIVALADGNMEPALPNGVNLRDIKVDVKSRLYRIPPDLFAHSQQAIEIFKSTKRLNFKDGEWENNDCFSVSSFQDGLIECQRAKYFDQIGTNITMDWDSGLIKGGSTIRSTIEKNPKGALPAFQDSCLANTIGTAVMVLNNELRPIVRVRNPNMGSIPHAGLHSSVSGVLEPSKTMAFGRQTFDVFRPGTEAELLSEMGLHPNEYNLYPVAFARELPRGGKPQIFWVAVTNLSDEQIRDRMAKAEEASEFVPSDEFDFFQQELDYYKTVADRFTYEGLAAFLFTEAFIDTNRDKIAG